MESGFLHETKTILKSLVISCPNGMTVDRLNRDYRDTVGGCIPFKKLGYQSLELFLRSLTDTLVLTGHGREAMVGFVSSDKTQHINEMINRQKNTTRGRKAAVRLQPVQNSRPVLGRPSQNKLFNQAVSRIYCTYNPNPIQLNRYLHVYQPQPIFYQHTIQQNIQNKPINFLPEKSNIQLSKSNTDINIKKTDPPCQKPNSKVFLNKIGENKKTQTNNIVKQNNSMCNEVNKSSISVDQNNSKRILSEPRNLKSVLIDIQNSNNVSASKDNLMNSIEDRKNTNGNSNKNTSLKSADKIISASKDNLRNITEDRKNTNENSNKNTSLKSADKIIFPSKSNVTENPEKKTSGYTASSSIKSQEQPVSNSKIPSEKPLKEQVQQKMPSPVVQPDSKNSSDSLKFPNAPVKFSMKKKLSEKIIKRPELPTVSESHALINPKVKSADPDLISVVSKTSSVEDNINRSRYITEPFAQMDSSDNDIDEAVPEFAADYRVFHVDFPENTVPFGKKIPSVQLPKDFKKGAVIGVFISEIHSPFKFWFHPHKENHELDVLMSGIECFYERLGDADLLIPKSCITPGQVCVALYNDMWHRAEILTAVMKNKVKVLFVDYGTVSEVEIHYIKYLQNRFAETPVQAIRGSLSHIKPVSQVWQKRAIKEFLSLVAEIFLYAQIIEIDEKEATVYMVLCDTNSGQTMQINKLLVDRGFAKLDSEWDENKIKQNGYRKRHPRDIFPTFEMLETGEYPSLCELEQLLAQGIDYEKITEKIILSNLNSNYLSNNVSVIEDFPSHVEKMSFNLLDTNPFKSDIISEIISLKMFDK